MARESGPPEGTGKDATPAERREALNGRRRRVHWPSASRGQACHPPRSTQANGGIPDIYARDPPAAALRALPRPLTDRDRDQEAAGLPDRADYREAGALPRLDPALGQGPARRDPRPGPRRRRRASLPFTPRIRTRRSSSQAVDPEIDDRAFIEPGLSAAADRLRGTN